MIDRRTLLTTAAAATVAPALPHVSATMAQLVPWPPEIVELNSVTLSIARHHAAIRAASFFDVEGADELALHFDTEAEKEIARLADMPMEHPSSKRALARYIDDGYLTPSPDWKPPFVAEGNA